MKHLKYFENDEYTAEYIFKTSANWIGSEYEEELDDFTDEDFDNYNKGGYVYNEYKDKAIDYFGLSWELDEENDTLLTSTQFIGTEEEVEAEGLTEDDYDDLLDMAMSAQGIEFEIVENENHPNYLAKKEGEKYNL